MADQEQNPVFAIQRMYLKDLSLEIPNAPGIFLETQQPAVEISLEVNSEVVTEGIFEVTVTVTISTKVGEKVAFLVEVKQAGIFELRNIPEDQMEMVINVVCPNIIYPYLRSNAADVIQRSGFPPIHLAEINFESLYQQRRQQAEEEGAAEEPASGIIVPGARH